MGKLITTMTNAWVLIGPYIDGIQEIVDFLGDAITVLLGAIAVWALIWKRKQLSLALQMFRSSFHQQRISRVKEALHKIEVLNFENKEHRSEIRALLGQICGQLKGLVEIFPTLLGSFETLSDLTDDGSKKLTESRKRKVVHEIHGCLDDALFGISNEMTGEGNVQNS